MPAVVAVRLRGLCRVRFDQTDKQPVHRPDALHDDAEGAALAKEPSSPGNIIILWSLAVQLRASVEGADHPRRQAVRRTPRDDMAVHALIDGPPPQAIARSWRPGTLRELFRFAEAPFPHPS